MASRRSAGVPTCCAADFQVGTFNNLGGRRIGKSALQNMGGRFGNPRPGNSEVGVAAIGSDGVRIDERSAGQSG